MVGAAKRAAWRHSNLSGSEPAERSQGRTGVRAGCILTAHDERALLLERKVTGQAENNPCWTPLLAHFEGTQKLSTCLFPSWVTHWPSLKSITGVCQSLHSTVQTSFILSTLNVWNSDFYSCAVRLGSIPVLRYTRVIRNPDVWFSIRDETVWKFHITIIVTKIITVISIVAVLLKYVENVQKAMIHTEVTNCRSQIRLMKIVSFVPRLKVIFCVN